MTAPEHVLGHAQLEQRGLQEIQSFAARIQRYAYTDRNGWASASGYREVEDAGQLQLDQPF